MKSIQNELFKINLSEKLAIFNYNFPEELIDIFNFYLEDELNKNAAQEESSKEEASYIANEAQRIHGEQLVEEICSFADTYIRNVYKNALLRKPIENYSEIWIEKLKSTILNSSRPRLIIDVVNKDKNLVKRNLNKPIDISKIDNKINQEFNSVSSSEIIFRDFRKQDFANNLARTIHENFAELSDDEVKYVVSYVANQKTKGASANNLGRFCSNAIIECYRAKEKLKVKHPKFSEESVLQYNQKIDERRNDYNNPQYNCLLGDVDPIKNRVDNFLEDMKNLRETLKASDRILEEENVNKKVSALDESEGKIFEEKASSIDSEDITKSSRRVKFKTEEKSLKISSQFNEFEENNNLKVENNIPKGILKKVGKIFQR